MKRLLRTVVVTALSLWLISTFFPAVHFTSTGVLLAAAVVLTVLTIFVRPVLKVLFLPVNLVTFGLFAWLINVIVIWLAITLVPGFHIAAISIPPIEVGPLVFPALQLRPFWSMVLVSFLLSLGNGLIGSIL